MHGFEQRVVNSLPGERASTIYDVARLAGVSHQTVTRFLRGGTGVRIETAERVRKAISALDYHPNHIARSLRSGRSRRILALTHKVGHYGPSTILQSANSAAREAGYVLDIIAIGNLSTGASMEMFLNTLRQTECDGILTLLSTDAITEALKSQHFDVPIFAAGESETEGELMGSSATGMPDLVELIVSLGHETVAHIAGPRSWSAARNRHAALAAALKSKGITTLHVTEGDWSPESGYRAMQSILRESGATAVVAANDHMALGALLAAEEAGLSIPADISVTGVDDTPEARFLRPPLTTIALDFEAYGREAIAGLLALLGGADPPAASQPKAQLVVRSSTGPQRGCNAPDVALRI